MTEDEVIAAALRILEKRIRHGDCLSSPQSVRQYLQLAIGDREREVFVVVLLDAQNRVLAIEELFAGTLTQTSVYPREVVKCALRHNCASVLFAHNHPSGVSEPSQADQLLTETLRRALALVDVKVLDHFIVSRESAISFAERGLL
jgi:DNA repair protein RadC